MSKVPIRYSDELFDRICAEIASGRSLASICKDNGMPTVAGVMKWLNDKPEIVERYTRAREMQAETLFDELIDIADKATDAQTARLQVDTRKWYLSKVIPKKYGDKMDVTTDGEPMRPLFIIPPSDT
jgi:hypothetical protein